MKPHSSSAILLLSSACLVGAIWTHATLSSAHHWQRSSFDSAAEVTQALRLTGELVSVASVPVNASILELEVPVNAKVHKGDVIGESLPDATPHPSAELGDRIDQASAAVDTARATLQDLETRLAAAQARADETRSRLASAEIAVGAAQSAAQRDDALYREGMESQLKHDEALSTQEEARRQVDTQAALGSQSATTVEELELQVAEARAALRAAQEDRRAAESAIANPEIAAVRVPAVSPADGYLVQRDEFSRDFEIVSDLNRQIETQIPPARLSEVHIGQRATFALDGQPQLVLHAVVRKIGEVQASAAGSRCPVTLSVSDAAGLGSDSARVTITLE
ncbi:HlyD family efflux transporter periplasmic adaptor subunit [uncultured Paludibaculum sp.]|uniref:HlyD family secretion protein n=1 Tax=uncultured Paludibaculum sp. TaxID=1765020 RepID=UPI002AAB727C|nr:HlyD family efflux transporter periplasmic adaptor subunit [uncultured Paludibaculum sp.]